MFNINTSEVEQNDLPSYVTAGKIIFICDLHNGVPWICCCCCCGSEKSGWFVVDASKVLIRYQRHVDEYKTFLFAAELYVNTVFRICIVSL